MVTPELTNYIQTCIAQGISKEQIIKTLSAGGWQKADIVEGFQAVGQGQIPAQPKAPIKTVASQHAAGHQHKKSSGSLKWIVFIILLLMLAGGGWWFYTNHLAPIQSPDIVPTASTTPEIITTEEEPILSNAHDVYESDITSTEGNTLKEFFDTYSIGQPIPENIQTILTTYSDIPETFTTASALEVYICPTLTTCDFETARNMAYYMFAKTIEQLNADDSAAVATALSIVKSGKQIAETKGSWHFTQQLIGWSIQEIGYRALTTTQEKFENDYVNDADKEALIQTLRNDHRIALASEYDFMQEIANHLSTENYEFTDERIDIQEMDQLGEIEELKNTIAANPEQWNRDEVRGWIEQSKAVALHNISIACGAPLETSKVNLEFDASDESRENYLGALFYETFFLSVDEANNTRCQIETLINNL